MTISKSLVAIALVGGLIIGFHPGHWVAGVTGRVLGPFSVWLHQKIGGEQLSRVQDEEQRKVQDARIEELQRENDFLRVAAGLHLRPEQRPVQGAVFSYVRDGGVRQVVVNRGSRDWIAVGDVVMTAQGTLVGVVLQVLDRYAIVRAVGDPALDVTVRIEGGQVSGLLRVDGHEGLILDLVQKSESVTEGQVVVTSGNDQFPAGLVIGMVRSVDSESATLFKVVRVRAATEESGEGRVIITRP